MHFAIEVQEPSIDEDTHQKAKINLYFEAISYILEDVKRNSEFSSIGTWQLQSTAESS